MTIARLRTLTQRARAQQGHETSLAPCLSDGRSRRKLGCIVSDTRSKRDRIAAVVVTGLASLTLRISS
ncbi:hypothetical protein ASF34_09455 [Methylobacterium sp. Leaf106]|nr:hypothetical protein ASF34_09455 [Methylobacterium sp. Leaf106]